VYGASKTNLFSERTDQPFYVYEKVHGEQILFQSLAHPVVKQGIKLSKRLEDSLHTCNVNLFVTNTLRLKVKRKVVGQFSK